MKEGLLFDIGEGERLKAEGMDRAETKSKEEWLNNARHIARYLANQYYEVTIDDVAKRFIQLYGVPMHKVLGMAAGSVFRSGFRRIGYRKTERASSHARPISVWVLADE